MLRGEVLVCLRVFIINESCLNQRGVGWHIILYKRSSVCWHAEISYTTLFGLYGFVYLIHSGSGAAVTTTFFVGIN